MKKIRYLVMLVCMSYTAFSQSNLSTVTNYSVGKAFTCITVDPARNVWAGTFKAGLHRLNQNAGEAVFTEVPASNFINLPHYAMNSVAADNAGILWLGHSGLGNTDFVTGGLEKIDIVQNKVVDHYTPDVNAECYTFLQNDGLAAGNVSSMALDKNGTLWAAQRWHSHTITLPARYTPGSLSYKRAHSELFVSKSTWKEYQSGNEAKELPYPAYTCKVPVSEVAGTRQCEAVACSNNEVWVSVYPYKYTKTHHTTSNNGQELPTETLPARILRYDLFGSYLGQLTFDSVGATPGPVFNAIYLNSKTDAWVGLGTGNGFAVRVKGCWTVINSATMPEVFLPGARTNTNAIWGNNQGQVFIGTTKGLIVYNGVGQVSNALSYTLYTVASSSIASDNITGGFNEKDSIQWVATDKGISRIVSGNNFSLDENYTSCGNVAINAIEDQAKDNQDHLDWHSYKVETYICDSEGPNGSNCNAQYVYGMMKTNASLTAPIPLDFPWGMNPYASAFAGFTVNEMEAIGQKIISAEVPITSLAFLALDILEEVDETNKIPFGNILNSNKDYVVIQAAANPFAVEPCVRYKLYNNTTFMIGRIKFNKYLDNTICGNQLESMEYDPVWIYPDDKNLCITNYTAPGHFLSPGKIERRVVEECGKVKVITIGTGRQYCGDNTIGLIGGKANKVTGQIIFKNIDLRLRAAFEEQ